MTLFLITCQHLGSLPFRLLFLKTSWFLSRALNCDRGVMLCQHLICAFLFSRLFWPTDGSHSLGFDNVCALVCPWGLNWAKKPIPICTKSFLNRCSCIDESHSMFLRIHYARSQQETVFASCDSWTKRLMVEPVFWQGFALRSSEPSLRLCGHWFLGGLDDEVLRSEKTHFSLTPLVLCTKCAQPLSDKHLCTQAIVVMRYPAAKMLQSLINLISVFIINIIECRNNPHRCNNCSIDKW